MIKELEEKVNKLRAEKIVYIAALCSELNSAGDSIKWTKRVLGEYADAMFETEDGLNALSFEYLDILATDLKERLEILGSK